MDLLLNSHIYIPMILLASSLPDFRALRFSRQCASSLNITNDTNAGVVYIFHLLAIPVTCYNYNQLSVSMFISLRKARLEQNHQTVYMIMFFSTHCSFSGERIKNSLQPQDSRITMQNTFCHRNFLKKSGVPGSLSSHLPTTIPPRSSHWLLLLVPLSHRPLHPVKHLSQRLLPREKVTILEEVQGCRPAAMLC